MAVHSYPYITSTIEPSAAFPYGQTIPRALIEVALQNADKRIEPFYALIDSGSDYCLFPADFAPLLGLNLIVMPGVTGYGLGDDSDMRFAPLELEIGGLGKWEVYAAFSTLWNGRGMGLIGHLGFFDRFRVRFDWRRKVFDVEE